MITSERFHKEDREETDNAIQREITNLNTLKLFKILLRNMLILERERPSE
jgi:hypothetical protein